MLASARGYLDDVKALLSSDDAPLPTDGAVADKRRATPAHYAAAHGRLPVLRHLWSVGAELDAEDSSGKTPLHYAVAGKAKEAVEFLVSTAKVWPGAPDGTGDDIPLHLAARSGDVALAKVLLKAVNGGGGGGTNGGACELLKEKNKRGLTPLGEALLLPVSSGAAASVAAAGKDDGELRKPLPVSSSSSKISKEDVFAMADALVGGEGAAGRVLRVVQRENSPRGWPLLHVLSAAGSADGVEWLLSRCLDNEEREEEKSSASVSFVNEHSSEATGSLTPLHAAAVGGSAGAAELLLAAGADASSLDGAGRTPAKAFEAAFAAAAKASSAAAAAAAASAAAPTTTSSSAPPPLLASADDAKKLRSLLEVSSCSSAAAAAKKGPASSFSSSSSSSSSATFSASVKAFSNDSSSDSFSFSFESPAATFKALPLAEQLATAKRWSQLDDDDALGAATSMYSPAAFEQAKLARGMRHAKLIAQVVASLHDDEDFQEAAKLKRVKEAVAAVRRDPSSIGQFCEDPEAMDVLLGLRKLQAVCAANGRHVVPFEELVVESGARSTKQEEDADRIAGLGKLLEDHLRAAVAAAAEDDPKEACAAAERALAEARAGGGGGGRGAAPGAAASTSKSAATAAEPTGLLARAKAILAAASADAEAAEAAARSGGENDAVRSSETAKQPFDWPAFWKSLSKAMAASLIRAAIALLVLWMVMRATTPPATVVVPPPASATEAEL